MAEAADCGDLGVGHQLRVGGKAGGGRDEVVERADDVDAGSADRLDVPGRHLPAPLLEPCR